MVFLLYVLDSILSRRRFDTRYFSRIPHTLAFAHSLFYELIYAPGNRKSKLQARVE